MTVNLILIPQELRMNYILHFHYPRPLSPIYLNNNFNERFQTLYYIFEVTAQKCLNRICLHINQKSNRIINKHSVIYTFQMLTLDWDRISQLEKSINSSFPFEILLSESITFQICSSEMAKIITYLHLMTKRPSLFLVPEKFEEFIQ